jgi:hypothetical protein
MAAEPTINARPIGVPTWPVARPRRWVAALAGTVGLLLLAAWAVPPMLDWGRFRTAIAAIASARLGRPVAIGGDITLRLLPQAVLTANDVTLGDVGDGISVQVSALRLQVATLPLLTGQLRLRDLVLSAPVLHLPLSLPDGLVHPSRPQIPHAFAARIENGTLRIGQTEVTGITASIHGGPALASTASTLSELPGSEALGANGVPVAAFGAEGFARAAGRVWRFTGALGAPDADGVSAVDISVRGQAGSQGTAAADTGGTLQATLADGILQGRLHAGGPDLSLLMPASPQAWQADAPFVASSDRIDANAITLSLGGAPADGALTVQLNAPVRIEGRLHAAAIDLDGWADLLGRSFTTPAAAPAAPQREATVLPRLHIALAAETAHLLAGNLQNLHATLVSDGHTLGFEDAQAGLPGGANLSARTAHLSQTDADGAPTPLALSGEVELAAPNLRATLAWLHALAPSQIDALPPGVLAAAALSARVTLRHAGMSATGLSGQIDAAPVTGGFDLRLGARPYLDATLAVDRLNLDAWLPETPKHPGLADTGAHFTGAETSLHIKAKQASWRGLALTGLALDARTGAGGLQLAAAQATLAGAHLTASGNLGPDGRLLGAQAGITTADLAQLATLLPRDIAIPAPNLWHGPGSLALAADGPPDALAIQLHAEADDAVLEAEITRDTLAGSGAETITLRHPGAPRFLATLGLPGGMNAAVAWLDTGALTLRAHLQSRPGHLVAEDFDLDAAALRLGGHLEADWSGATPSLTGSLAAEQLALPPSLPTPNQWPALGGLTTQLHITAPAVLVGLRPTASHFSADITTAGPNLFADNAAADIAHGHATGQIAADVSQHQFAAHFTLTGAQLDAPLTGWPIDLDAGTLSATADLWTGDAGWPNLSGNLHLALTSLNATGLDLAAVARAAALHTRAGRAQLQTALNSGRSPNLSGTADATIEAGILALAPTRLTSPDGTITITGTANLPANTVDLRVTAANYPLRLTGPFAAVRRMAATHPLPNPRPHPSSATNGPD